MGNSIHDLNFFLVFISNHPGENFPENNTESIHICLFWSDLVFDEFRSHLSNSPDSWRFLDCFLLELVLNSKVLFFRNSFWNSKVTDFDFVKLVDKNVFSFEISVENNFVERVKVNHCLTNLYWDFKFFLYWQMNWKVFKQV